MGESKRNGVDWGSLLIGILFILTALLSFQDPLGSLASIVVYFAVLAIFKGIFEITYRNRVKKMTGYKSYSLIVLGIINIVIGIYFLMNLKVGIAILPFVFATWFMSDSIVGLITLDRAKAVGTGYFWFSIIINILGLILGAMLFLNPISSGLTLSFLVGFYFMIFGINNLIYAFR